MITSNSNQQERSMETAQPASKKARVTNRGTWSRSFAEVVRDRKIIGVIDQSDEGGGIPINQWGLVRRALASVALIAQMQGGTRAMLSWSPARTRDRQHCTRLPLKRSARSTPGLPGRPDINLGLVDWDFAEIRVRLRLASTVIHQGSLFFVLTAQLYKATPTFHASCWSSMSVNVCLVSVWPCWDRLL